MEVVQDIFLKILSQRKEWQHFLEKLGIQEFSEKELETVTETIGIFDSVSGELLATGSLAGETLKYIAVCSKNETEGKRFNRLVTELLNRQAARGVFHAFVFTKPQYLASFSFLGFQLLARSELGLLLERGRPGIEDYLAKIKQTDIKGQKVAAIVMNANPFTQGHRYLVERASAENDWVYVFVVAADQSLFTAKDRLRLVKEGLSALTNVTVVSGGDYMVSYTTFPAYFINTPDEVIHYQTVLDARLFKEWIAPALGITVRYMGSEPLSRTTALYNETLQRELPPEIEVKILERKRSDGAIISATAVREAIRDDTIKKIKAFVPQTTYDFMLSALTELQNRIERGQKINGN